MKYLLAAVAITSLFSCKKSGEDPYGSFCPAGYDDHQVAGKWRKIATYNGMSGQPDPPDNTYTVLVLRTNNTYAVTVNGQLTQSGTYIPDSVASTIYGAKRPAVIFDGNSIPMLVHTFHDSMSLAPDVFDGGGTLYRRDCR